MISTRCGWRALAATAAALGVVLTLGSLGPARAQDKTYTMKISLATINDQIHAFTKNFAAALEKNSGGRIKTEIYPASQLGSIPRQTEGVQFGAIQCQVVPPEFLVGLDERFEVMAAPGLIDSMARGQKLAADPDVLKLMLGLGADKGLHGVGLFMVNPSAIASKVPIRHMADFKGKKIRIFASPFQSVSFDRLGATPVAMSLGDVLPALQQGAIDGAVASTAIFTAFHYQDAAKYATETGQPAIFAIVEISKKWFDTLPADLQQIIEKDRRAGNGGGQSAGDRNHRELAKSLDRHRRRVDQPAGRRTGVLSEASGKRRLRRIEAEAAFERGLSDRVGRGGADKVGRCTVRLSLAFFSSAAVRHTTDFCVGFCRISVS